MSDYQDAEAYRLQARLWQRQADTLSHGKKSDICRVIADGYARLAALIEQRVVNGARMGLASGTNQGQQSTIS